MNRIKVTAGATPKQARKGGEIGANGEFYRGGQFLPTTENCEKGAYRDRQKAGKAGGKGLVARGVWEVRPDEFSFSLFEFIGQDLYNFQQGDWEEIFIRRFKTTEGMAEHKAFMESMIEKYNQGCRWFYRYKNVPVAPEHCF